MTAIQPADGARLLKNISWERAKPEVVGRDIVRLLTAASLVESRGEAYGEYVARVFSDDPVFVRLIERWAQEENEHGIALDAWLKRAIPNFDFSALLKKYNQGITLAYEGSLDTRSIRGSKAAELLSRCAVESATSTYYKAVEATVEDEPLKIICSRLAHDEIKHYALFRRKLDELREIQPVSSLKLLYMSIRRLFELSDDQMSYAYYVACGTDAPYNRLHYSTVVTKIGFRLYSNEILSELIKMNLRAFGLSKSRVLNSIGYNNVVSLFVGALRGYMSVRLFTMEMILALRLAFSRSHPKGQLNG